MSDDPLAALEAEYEVVETEEVETPESLDHEEHEESEHDQQEEEQEAAPPGYLSYEDWVAQGKDPDMYKGKKAYEAEYARIQEVKELKSSMKSMDATLRSTVDAIAERESKQEARHRKELEAALAQAKEDGDTDAALEAYEQLNEIKPKPQAPRTHPVISDFITSNPVLAVDEVKDEFARIYNGKLRADGVGQSDALSDVAIKGYARSTMERIKEIFPERFSSPRNNRPTPARPKAKAATNVDIGQRMKQVKVDSLAPQNRDAANEIYEMIKARDPKEAEIFAKKVLGE